MNIWLFLYIPVTALVVAGQLSRSSLIAVTPIPYSVPGLRPTKKRNKFSPLKPSDKPKPSIFHIVVVFRSSRVGNIFHTCHNAVSISSAHHINPIIFCGCIKEPLHSPETIFAIIQEIPRSPHIPFIRALSPTLCPS